MNARQLELLSDDLLAEPDTAGLREFLRWRGWTMTLAELDEERRQRGLRPAVNDGGYRSERHRRRTRNSRAYGSGYPKEEQA